MKNIVLLASGGGSSVENILRFFIDDKKELWGRSLNDIPIKSIRSGNVTGTHTVNYSSKIDSIRLEHIAHNRHGFALGAVIAAEWIIGKNGIFTLNDVLDLN